MAVTTTKTNKPLNPRGNDQSPKGYNRAELYSGKALDFDGVNDKVEPGTLDITDYTGISILCYFNKDTTNNDILVAIKHTGIDDIRITTNTNIEVGVDDGTYYNVNTPINSGEWYKVVLVFDGSTLKGYLNGQEFGSTSASFDFSTADGKVTIGQRDGGTSIYNGEIAGVKIFNTALTAAQVADLYNNPEKIVPTGVADSALKLWLPMQEGAGTTCINGAPDALGSDVVTNGDFATDSDWTKGTGWSIGSGVASCDGTQTGNTGLNQSNTLLNLTANEYYYIQYDISNYVAGSINPHLRGTAGGNVSGNGTKRAIIKAGTGTTYGLSMYASSTFDADIDNIVIKEISNVGEISGATWTHGIGAPVAQTAVIDWNKHTYNVSTEILVPQGLTAGRDLLGNLFENVRKQGALNLDGNSWAEVHDNASLDISPDMTMEAWIYAEDLTDNVYDHILVKQSGLNWSGDYGRYVMRLAGNKVQWWFDSFSNAKNYSVILSGWNHIAITKDGTAEVLYINGSQADTNTGVATITASDFSLLIGTRTQIAEHYEKPIAQPRIYNRALTAEEVQRNYDAGKNIYS